MTTPGSLPPRSYPSFPTYIGVGALLGIIVAAVLTYSSQGEQEMMDRGYSASTAFGYLGLGLAGLGALVGALIAIAVDARRRP